MSVQSFTVGGTLGYADGPDDPEMYPSGHTTASPAGSHDGAILADGADGTYVHLIQSATGGGGTGYWDPAQVDIVAGPLADGLISDIKVTLRARWANPSVAHTAGLYVSIYGDNIAFASQSLTDMTDSFTYYEVSFQLGTDTWVQDHARLALSGSGKIEIASMWADTPGNLLTTWTEVSQIGVEVTVTSPDAPPPPPPVVVPVTTPAHHGIRSAIYTAAEPIAPPSSATEIKAASGPVSVWDGSPTFVGDNTNDDYGADNPYRSILTDDSLSTYVVVKESTFDRVQVHLQDPKGLSSGSTNGSGLDNATSIRLHIVASAPIAQDLAWNLAGNDPDAEFNFGTRWTVPGGNVVSEYDYVYVPNDPDLYFANDFAPTTQQIGQQIGRILCDLDFFDNAIPGGSQITVYSAEVWVTTSTSTLVVPENRVIIRGPQTPEHLGAFRIAPTRTLSAQVQMGSDTEVWAQAEAHYFFDDGTGTLQPTLQVDPIGPPLLLGSPPMQWREQNLFTETTAVATHWLLAFRLTPNDPRIDRDTRLPEGTQVAFDCAYVPDNGLDLLDNEQPYLDGDQPGAMWEGEPHNSPSIYGVRAALSPFRAVVLGNALITTQGV
jgi:hypothetical protein